MASSARRRFCGRIVPPCDEPDDVVPLLRVIDLMAVQLSRSVKHRCERDPAKRDCGGNEKRVYIDAR